MSESTVTTGSPDQRTTPNLEWKGSLATALSAATATVPTQAAGCEQQLMAGLAEDARAMASEFLAKLMPRITNYVECKLGAGTPQAQVAKSEVVQVVVQCSIASLGLLIAGNYPGFATAVIACVIGKLGTGGGTPVPPGPGGKQLTADDFSAAPRCS